VVLHRVGSHLDDSLHLCPLISTGLALTCRERRDYLLDIGGVPDPVGGTCIRRDLYAFPTFDIFNIPSFSCPPFFLRCAAVGISTTLAWHGLGEDGTAASLYSPNITRSPVVQDYS
jgi:hypothetical protein